MPKAKTDPIVGVLHYFETASDAEVKQALALIKHTVAKRNGVATPKKAKATKAPKATEAPATPPGV